MELALLWGWGWGGGASWVERAFLIFVKTHRFGRSSSPAKGTVWLTPRDCSTSAYARAFCTIIASHSCLECNSCSG